MTKKTSWFPPHINPVHVGPYQIKIRDGFCFSHWDGKKWGLMSSNVLAAEKAKYTTSWHQDRSWRGLTEKAT